MQLAAALVHQPEVLVLDEPFSGLDPVGVDVLAEVLQGEAARGVPVVFSSHQLELVERLCDEYVLINEGRTVASGRVNDLDTSLPELFRAKTRPGATGRAQDPSEVVS